MRYIEVAKTIKELARNIPLPGTGAWTGTLAASILDMKFKDVLIACMGGVLLAGIIMGLASAGLLGALSGLFAAG